MPEIGHAVSKYFTPSKGTFWKWSDDRQTVLWTFGGTIAFRRELELLLEGLAAEGLPPFENILMVVGACRNQAFMRALRSADVLDFRNYPMRFSLVESVSKVVDSLDMLTNLPEDLRTSISGKRAILALVSENGPRRNPIDFSRECVAWLGQDEAFLTAPHVKSTSDWSSELRGLHDGLMAVNEPAVRLRMQTGVELAPTAAPIPLQLPPPTVEPPPLTIRELLLDLQEDDEYAGLVRLTQRLISIMSLPRSLTTPDDLPLGGVADITNRGAFDRLLLSELAHDSDVLMTRVALNEAMYIRREVPPDFPPRDCQVLVDTGIRMWGLPRLYATAVALALAIVQDGKSVPHLFRTSADGPIPIDVTSREQFMQHLASLEFAVQPGAALSQLIVKAQGTSADFVLVTGEDVLADAEFRQCLAALPPVNLYLVAVTREGQLRLLQRSRQGERVLKQARLDLDQILAAPAKRAPKLRDLSIDPRLPAICRVRPFPLLLSPQVLDDNCGGCIDRLTSNQPVEKLLAITGDRRLLRWNGPGLGATQYSDRMPAGKLLWHNSTLFDRDEVQLIIGNREHCRLFKVTATPEAQEIKPFNLPFTGPITGIYEHAGIVYISFQRQTALYSLTTCERLAVAEHWPSSEWNHGRFFYQRRGNQLGYWALSFDGQKICWDYILSVVDLQGADISTIYDCQCLACPVVVTSENAMIQTDNKEVLNFRVKFDSTTPAPSGPSMKRFFDTDVPMKVAAVSPDGNRCVLAYQSGQLQHPNEIPPVSSQPLYRYHWVIDFSMMTANLIWGLPKRLLYRQAFALLNQRNLRNRFTMAGILGDRLALVTAKQQVVLFIPQSNQDRIELCTIELSPSNIGHAVKFEFLEAPSGVGYEFKKAEWPDGSRAILDSRGLLHLQSSDPAIPEMTLVLNEGDVAGWCDRNLVWGDKALTGTYAHRTNPERAFLEWLTPFCQRLK